MGKYLIFILFTYPRVAFWQGTVVPMNFFLLSQCCTLISMCFSGFVVLTAVVFPKMIRKKIFMEMIVGISIADILGNWPYTVPYFPRNGTALCTMEGFCNLYFFPVSWLYSTSLAFFLWSLVVFERLLLTRIQMHALVLGVPLIFTLAMLSTNTYGVLTSLEGEDICVYGGNESSGNLWHFTTYFALLFLCFVLMSAWMLHLQYMSVVQRDKVALGPTYKLAKQALILYPVALLVCWFPHAIVQLAANADYTNPLTVRVMYFCNLLKILHGAITATIFFSHSREAQQQWTRLLQNYFSDLAVRFMCTCFGFVCCCLCCMGQRRSPHQSWLSSTTLDLNNKDGAAVEEVEDFPVDICQAMQRDKEADQQRSEAGRGSELALTFVPTYNSMHI